MARFEMTTVLGRMGQPEEIATAALFLSCEDSSYVTGTELAADGGAAQVRTSADCALQEP